MEALMLKCILKSLLLSVIPAVLLIPVLSYDASAQSCSVQICKSAEDSGDTEFPFIAVDINEMFESFSLLGGGEGEGSCIQTSIPQGQPLTVFEEFLPGWVLDHIECELIGVDFQILDDGNTLGLICNVPTANGTCTFFNVRGDIVRNIPTLSEWGMIAAAAGLALVGVFFVIRRKRAAVNS
jgi:hypothetical protein